MGVHFVVVLTLSIKLYPTIHKIMQSTLAGLDYRQWRLTNENINRFSIYPFNHSAKRRYYLSLSRVYVSVISVSAAILKIPRPANYRFRKRTHMFLSEVESSRTSLASRTSSRTHFEVLGLGLEASSPRKVACPRLEDSSIFWIVKI